MIDWLSLFFNALWIVGLALLLAAGSYAVYDRHSPGPDEQPAQPGTPVNHAVYRGMLMAGGILFCLGMASLSDVLWQRLAWVALGLGCVLQFGRRERQKGGLG
ncbi:MAG: hypothetical protein GYA17_08550 [Chloroflexi bacterium]|jgi:hypothetical protein|nr:hypothetical protein [Anaerolineaceae bacterium]NMB88399.1 hypothetical protein [Chloroflexota bacterium]